MPFNFNSHKAGFDLTHLLHHLKRPTELGEIYLSSGIYHFVASLTGLFVPLYLINVLSFSLAEVLIVLAAISAIRAGAMLPSGQIIAKIGPKHAMIASFPLSFLIYLFLFLLPSNQHLIFPIVILEGIFVALYASAFHVELSKGSHEKTRGREVAKMLLFNSLALATGPFIGALIIQSYGFSSLLVLAMILLVLASLPLLMTPEIYHKREFDLKRVNFKEIRPDLLGSMFENIEIIAGVTIWAIFIYFFVQNYAVVGGARTLQLLVAAIAMYLAGKYADRFDKKKMLKLGSSLMSLVALARVFARNSVAIIAVDLLRGLVLPLKNVPYTTLYYRHADEQPRMEYVFAMEVFGALAISALMIFAALINLLYGDLVSLIFLLVSGAVAAYGVRLVR